MTDEPKPFIDYWNEVDQAMQMLYNIDTLDAGIEPEEIAHAQEAGNEPSDYVLWFGQKRDLTLREEWGSDISNAMDVISKLKDRMKGPQ